MPKPPKIYPVLGWREWISLPDLKISAIKVKVDTGARTSALHATDIKYFKRKGKSWVRFSVHPNQRSGDQEIRCEAPMVEKRSIKSSIGTETHRPVIHTTLEIGDYHGEIELTLVNRDIMGFRMLLGRQAMRGHFLVDPGKSYIIGPGTISKSKMKAIIKVKTKR